MRLSDTTIIIPTFHRRGYLRDCLHGISWNLPECDVIVVSDDDEGTKGNCTVWRTLPYDTGLTGKRNLGVNLTRTKYTLIGSDDYDFSTTWARKSVIEMMMVLKYNQCVDVVAGRVNNKPYEGFLEYVKGSYIKEHRLHATDVPFILKPFVLYSIDIAANFFLARTEVLREIPWDANIRPIGGEHADFFLDLKAAGKCVAFLPYANINTFPYDASKQHPDYREFRRRANIGHELMMRKRDIKDYYGFDQQVPVVRSPGGCVK
jgi:hypothetical protein